MNYKIRNIVVLVLLLILGACSKSKEAGGDQEGQPPVPPPYVPDNHVVAHRGAWKEFGLPDNSIAALQKAMEISCYASECDLALTSDKQVIIFHDEMIGGKYIKNMTYAEIKASHSLSNGEKVPLLSDFLDKLVANKKIQLWMDVKSLSDAAGGNEWSSQAAEAAAILVREKNAQKQVSFVVGRKAVLDRSILAAKGDWSSAYMNTDYTPAQFVSNGYTWANFTYDKFYTSSSNTNSVLIDEFKAKNVKLTVYTVDDDGAMNWFAGRSNIDAITSNYPFKLLQKVRKK